MAERRCVITIIMPSISLNTAKIYLSRFGIPDEVVEYMYDYHMKIELEKAFANSLHDISIYRVGSYNYQRCNYLSDKYSCWTGEYKNPKSLLSYRNKYVKEYSQMLSFVRDGKGFDEYFDVAECRFEADSDVLYDIESPPLNDKKKCLRAYRMNIYKNKSCWGCDCPYEYCSDGGGLSVYSNGRFICRDCDFESYCFDDDD